jgi:hypothetical protein
MILFFIFYVFLCMMFIIVYHEQNNHEQNLLQFLAGCELLSTPWTSDFLHSKNRSKLCRSKRTKRTNLWRLETARNWNFWKLWDMIFFWTFRMLSIDESRVFAAKVCKSLRMRHLMQFTDSHDSLNFSWPRVDAIPKVPGCGFECGRWRFLCFWSQIWIP